MGQEEDFEAARKKANNLGAKKVRFNVAIIFSLASRFYADPNCPDILYSLEHSQ